jgi:hypothetical protein
MYLDDSRELVPRRVFRAAVQDLNGASLLSFSLCFSSQLQSKLIIHAHKRENRDQHCSHKMRAGSGENVSFVLLKEPVKPFVRPL